MSKRILFVDGDPTGQEGQTQSIARESGIHWFAIKPLSISELSATVEAIMNRLAN